MRPLKNALFYPISASGSNLNPRNTKGIPVVKIFAFLDLEQNGAFFKGLPMVRRHHEHDRVSVVFVLMAQYTLVLQKSRMLQIQGIEGEAVVTYRESSITKEKPYPRLSRRVKNMTNLPDFWNLPSINSSNGCQSEKRSCYHCF
jgi:hypothetical protein